MVSKRLMDAALFILIPGVGGFIIGFLRAVPQWLVYEDPVYFSQGLNLGFLLGAVLSVLGFLVVIFRWYKYPHLYQVSPNQISEKQSFEDQSTSNTEEINTIVKEIQAKYSDVDKSDPEIIEKVDFFKEKYSDFQANKISEQVFKVIAFKTKQFLEEKADN